MSSINACKIALLIESLNEVYSSGNLKLNLYFKYINEALTSFTLYVTMCNVNVSYIRENINCIKVFFEVTAREKYRQKKI